MDTGFVQERITQLRLQKGVSEYKMSYDVGHSRGYVYNISFGMLIQTFSKHRPVVRCPPHPPSRLQYFSL